MRRAITLAIKAGQHKMLLGPEVPIRDHIAAFKTRVNAPNPEGFEKIEIWTSDSRARSYRFKTITPAEKTPAAPKSTPASTTK